MKSLSRLGCWGGCSSNHIECAIFGCDDAISRPSKRNSASNANCEANLTEDRERKTRTTHLADKLQTNGGHKLMPRTGQ
eukprot:1511862-Amphidinium_carterae.1